MLNLSDLGPRSMNDLDLWHSQNFMYLFSFLHLTNFDTKLVTKVSEKFIVLPFSVQKHKRQYDLAVKKLTVNAGSSFEQTWEYSSTQCYIPSVNNIGHCVPKKKIFTIYGHGGYLGHVTRIFWANFRSPISRRLHVKFDSDWPSSFWEDVWGVCMTMTEDRSLPILSYKLTDEPSGSGELTTYGNLLTVSCRSWLPPFGNQHFIFTLL